MNNFKKTLFFIIFFYCGNIFSNDLIEIRSGHNNNKYRIVFEFKDEIKYKKEIKSKTLKLFFNTSDRIKNLSEFKKIQNVSDGDEWLQQYFHLNLLAYGNFHV